MDRYRNHGYNSNMQRRAAHNAYTFLPTVRYCHSFFSSRILQTIPHRNIQKIQGGIAIYLKETEYRKGVLAVCDRESFYTGQLMEYMDDCRKLPFEVQAFTAPEALADYVRQHPVDLLLASAEFVPDVQGEENIHRIMLLTEEQEDMSNANMTAAYKYQSADALLEQVLNYYEQEFPKVQPASCPRRETRFYAVYSPVKRCGKTGFAIMLGQAMAEQRRVLYLNFEEYPGFQFLFGKEDCDASELILHLLQGREGVYRKLRNLVKPLGHIDYLPPGIGHTDYHHLEWEHWERLIESVKEEEFYDVVILDMGDLPEVLFSVFDYCAAIYMPVLQDPVSMAKLEEFKWILGSTENGKHMGKLLPVMPPAESYWEMMGEDKLYKSELYCYARNLLEG